MGWWHDCWPDEPPSKGLSLLYVLMVGISVKFPESLRSRWRSSSYPVEVVRKTFYSDFISLFSHVSNYEQFQKYPCRRYFNACYRTYINDSSFICDLFFQDGRRRQWKSVINASSQEQCALIMIKPASKIRLCLWDSHWTNNSDQPPGIAMFYATLSYHEMLKIVCTFLLLGSFQ